MEGKERIGGGGEEKWELGEMGKGRESGEREGRANREKEKRGRERRKRVNEEGEGRGINSGG